MPQKRWRIDGNFVASPGEFLLQGNPAVQRTHCALAVTPCKGVWLSQDVIQEVC